MVTLLQRQVPRHPDMEFDLRRLLLLCDDGACLSIPDLTYSA